MGRWLGAGLVMLALGCARGEAADLDRYVHVERKRVEPYERKLEDAGSGAHELAHLASVYLEALEQIKPGTRAVQELHALAIKAARTRLAAQTDFETALKRGDRSLGNRARERFALARRQRAEYRNRLNQLEQANGVRP